MSPDASILLRSEESADAISIIEVTVPAGWDGPPLHHHAFDEAFYVLAGELTFQLGDTLATRGPGTPTFAPRGAHHTLANLGATEARYCSSAFPAGSSVASTASRRSRPRRQSRGRRRSS